MPATRTIKRLTCIVIFFTLLSCASAQTDPTQLVFGPFTEIAPYNNANEYTLVSDAQIQPSSVVFDNNTFIATSNFSVLRNIDPSTTFSAASNVGTITTGMASQADYIIGSNTSPAFKGPQVFVSVEIDQNGTTSGTDHIAVGLASSTVQMIAEDDVVTGTCFVVVYQGSTYTTFGSTSCATPTAPWRLGFSLVGTYARVWKNTGSGWESITGSTINGTYDPRIMGNLNGLYPAVKTYTSQTTTWKVSNLKSSPFGGVGIRDVATVDNTDGSPYFNGSTTYFMATIAGVEGINESSEGIFSINMSTMTPTMLGIVMMQNGGSIYTDQAGQLLINTVAGNQQLLMSTWAEPSLGIVYSSYQSSATNLLSGGVFVVPVTASFTTINSGAYDPFMICPASGFNYATGSCSSWMLVTSEYSGSSPHLFTSTSLPSDNSWTLVASAGVACEGSRIGCLRTGGVSNYFPMWACIINSLSTHYTNVYSPSMLLLGTINATMPTPHGNGNPPHANIFALGDYAYYLTFDDTSFSGAGAGNQNMGNLVVAKAPISTASACYDSRVTTGNRWVVQGSAIQQGAFVAQ